MFKGWKLPARVAALALGLLLILPFIGVESVFASGAPRAIRDNVAPYTDVPDNIPAAITFKYPTTNPFSTIWIGELTTGCNVRTGPGPQYPVDRSWQQGRRVLVYRTTVATTAEIWYQVAQYPEPDLYVWSTCVRQVAPLQIPTVKHTGKWVDVNLTQQVLIAYEGNKPVLLAQVASGKAGHETRTGSWRVFWRLQLQDMDGGSKTSLLDPYYNVKDVPYIQYFTQDGDALHGVYWHDNFGTPMSHGCVGMSYQNANWMYDWGVNGMYVEVHY